MALLYSSIPVSHGSLTLGLQQSESEASDWNSAIGNIIIYTWPLPTVACQMNTIAAVLKCKRPIFMYLLQCACYTCMYMYACVCACFCVQIGGQMCAGNCKVLSDTSTNQLSVRGKWVGLWWEESIGRGSWALCGRVCFRPNGASCFDVMRTQKHLVRNCQLWLNFISSLFLSVAISFSLLLCMFRSYFSFMVFL